ncbi:protein BZR1 homolog 4-like [Salvia hispanica]|uniref:protein BZR1 homolog 4-like n=1 Tax=Salvia hispanica TaxID=49212 RepID=UPI002009CCC9|nr:protein BZR1 homolog 4-like [Salvia hispanica]
MKEGGRSANGRSALERERTKMRERQRRSITTNIFHGLRKHGGYRLSPRADINEGATSCPLCGGGGRSVAATPSCSFLGGGGGECSTTASPRRVGESGGNNLSSSGAGATDDSLLSIYMSGGAAQNVGGGGGAAVFGEGQQLYLVRESRVANQNTPTGSP